MYTSYNQLVHNTMIHYINGKPHKNITLRKPKRHAVAHYRHTQRTNTIKDLLARTAIVTALMAVLYIAFVIGTS